MQYHCAKEMEGNGIYFNIPYNRMAHAILTGHE